MLVHGRHVRDRAGSPSGRLCALIAADSEQQPNRHAHARTDGAADARAAPCADARADVDVCADTYADGAYARSDAVLRHGRRH